MEITKSTNRNAALIIVVMGAFLIPFISGALNVALPKIGTEFAMDAVLLSWVSSGFLLSTIMFTVPFGRIADIYGRKKIYLYGMIAMIAVSLFQMVASSGAMLIAQQFVLGIAGAMILSANVAIISSAFPSGDRGKALGLNAAAAYFSTSMGPFLGGILTQHLVVYQFEIRK
jgi:MFS family permease